MLHIYSVVNMPSTGGATPIVTFDPPVTFDGCVITKMTFGRYANQRIGISLLARDPELDGAEAPYETLSHNEPYLKLSGASHFFTKNSALADAIVATGHIEKVTTGQACPICKTVYVPRYRTFEDANATEPGSIFTEQHISGICSDQCWGDASC
jgi:hypothetical protein